MTAATVGHNGAPPDEIPFMTWVFDLLGSEMTPAEKVVTLAAVILQTGSVQELAEATRLNARTVERSRARPARDGWLHIPFTGKEGGRGVRRIFWRQRQVWHGDLGLRKPRQFRQKPRLFLPKPRQKRPKPRQFVPKPRS
jgi:hypothetical protein